MTSTILSNSTYTITLNNTMSYTMLPNTTASYTLLPNTTNVTMTAAAGFQPSQTLVLAAQINLNLLLVLLMIALGCTMVWKEIKTVFIRPIPVTVGALCQFGFMPLIGFALAIAFDLPANIAIGTILIACCPGGSASNAMTYWSEGDITLSVCMTTVSNVLAIGMMPWILFLYTRYWVAESEVLIPGTTEIVVTLVVLLIPTAIGMLIRWKWARFAEKLAFVLNIIVNLQICMLLILNIITFPPVFKSGVKPYAIGIIYPFTAFGVGYLVSRFFKLEPRQARTVAFETGVQNGALALSLINYQILQGHNVAGMLIVPMFHTIFALVDGYMLVIAYWIYKRCILKEKGGLLSNRMKTTEKNKDKKDDEEQKDSFVSMVDVGIQTGM
ncbi:ileal sodium/bile acid cotransporter-like [Saccoglossus kowalevskii]|uniref:Ileal sodium/bile acid cotransporter-like n=1 Tax=Saccoglossus kowalevskii TaxID=10224 RepID=A0ABM0GW69_SACKO|nr:PREDICTED: ileal sodium/bile acid cotransporter-like [Saccoglossus kowalevskii]